MSRIGTKPIAIPTKFDRRAVLTGSAAIAGSFILRPDSVRSQTTFLTNQTLEVHSGHSDGSAANIPLQEWRRTVERLYPETQVIVRINSGGTAALTAAIIADAKPDGLTIGTGTMHSLLSRGRNKDYKDISQFSIIGSMRRSSSMLFASTASGITSIDDLVGIDEPVILPVRSTASGAYFTAFFCNALLGTRILPVTGYGSGARELAFLSGEGQLIMRPPESGRRYVDDGTGVPILTFVDQELPESFGAVSSLSQLDADPEFRWLEKYFAATSYSRILTTGKNVPPDRLEMLRKIHSRVVADPEFAATYEATSSLAPTEGEVVQKIIASVVSDFGNLESNIEKAVNCGMHIAKTGKPCVH